MVVLLLAAGPAAAQDEERRHIAVTGNAVVTAANDTAGFTTGVQVTRSSPGAALRAASARLQAIVGALRASGIAAESIRTARVDVRRPAAPKDGPRPRGHVATQTVNVTVHEVQRTGAVIDAAVVAGANRLTNLSFWRSQTGGLHREALGLALRRAREKAEALAAESGVTLGEVLRITESGADVSHYGSFVPPRPMAGLALPVPPTIKPGRTRVFADLTAVFAIA